MAQLLAEAANGITYDRQHRDMQQQYNNATQVASWSAQHFSGIDGFQRFVRFAELRPGETVLDVACGTGLVGLLACEVLGGGADQVFFADCSMAMLREAKR